MRSARDRTADSEVPTATGAEPWAAPHRALESLGAWDLAPSPIAELIAHDDDDDDADARGRDGFDSDRHMVYGGSDFQFN